MQFDDECRMIFACSNEIFAKIIRIVILWWEEDAESRNESERKTLDKHHSR
jgi:hypothetical protein